MVQFFCLTQLSYLTVSVSIACAIFVPLPLLQHCCRHSFWNVHLSMSLFLYEISSKLAEIWKIGNAQITNRKGNSDTKIGNE